MSPELMLRAAINTCFDNEYISPIYMTNSDIALPFADLTLTSFYNIIVEFAAVLYNIAMICMHTFVFIAKEATHSINTQLSFTEKILLCICLYNFIVLSVYEICMMQKNQEIQDKLESAEKELTYLKKAEKTRENWEQLAQHVRNMHIEYNKKMTEMEKQMNKMKKSINKYD